MCIVAHCLHPVQVATQAAATDPRTGTIDMDMITTGRTQLDRDLVLRLTGEEAYTCSVSMTVHANDATRYAEELRALLSRKKGQRLTVGQIRQIMLKEAGEASGGEGTCTASKIADARA